ncbi:hypothetical protein NHJ6243_000814 [Beauveria neobassiana]
MDTNAQRRNGFAVGTERISYSVPKSFFPLQDATTSSTTTDSSKTATQTWSNYLAGQRAKTQYRAWSRVEIPSHSACNFARTVMKRIGLPIPWNASAQTIPPPVAPIHIDFSLLADDGMPKRRVVRRLDSYEASSEEWQVGGKPFSSLAMLGLQLQAKAEVADCLRTYPTSTTQAEARQRRDGHYVQVIPQKRRTGMEHSAGNRLGTYIKAMELPKSTPHFRMPRRRFSPLPRPQATSPTLSPIALFTPNKEPVTPAAVMEPPRDMSDAKSPTKRSPRHTSPPIKNDGPRISEPAVKLLPATTPKIEPSPTKSVSPPPATPLGEKRRLRSILGTPSTFPKTAPFGNAFAGMRRHSAMRPSGAVPFSLSPIKLLATPCPSHRIVKRQNWLSPTKRTFPVAETPSRSVAEEPKTPRIFSNISYMTADVPSPIAFVSTLFPDSPVKRSIDLQSATPQKPADFEFGTASPAFNAVTWLNNVDTTPRPVASLKKSSRRLSEPLIRGCLKGQNRRQTMSPQKLGYQAEDTFAGLQGRSLGDRSSSRRQTISPKKLIFNGSDGLFSPAKKAGQPLTASVELKSSPSPGLHRVQKRRVSFGSKGRAALRQAKEVVKIDMRQNSDIFGSKPVLLSSSPGLSAALPSITESGHEVESSDEPAKPRLFSPSAEAQSRKAAEQTACLQTPTKLSQVAVQDASPVPIVGSPKAALGIIESLSAIDSLQASIEERKEVPGAEPRAISQSPSPVTSTSVSFFPRKQKLSPSPTLNLTFTPVNSRSPSALEASVLAEESIPESPLTNTTEIVETVTANSHDYDSPGRDYMREFIRRSRPKRSSTTETGSPVGITVKRQPLGAKSPNTESPSKNKRKLEKEHDEHESPLKRASDASPRKVRRYGGNISRKRTATKADGDEDEQIETLEVTTATDAAKNVEEQHVNTESDSKSRRSSRLRNQTRLPSAKSAIPTPIKLGRSSGPMLNSAVRSEQQDLKTQTRRNTLRNKGRSEQPAQFLARQQAEGQAEPEPLERDSESDKERRKCVNWNNPLAMYQEEVQRKETVTPKKGKSAKPKTVQMSGIAKPSTRAKTTADKERTARLAEHFGMVSNGTPAKPQRSTRSRMRM